MFTREELIRLKKEEKLSVRRLSELSGVPEGTITKIISGETKRPRPATMDALWQVFSGGLPYGTGFSRAVLQERAGRWSLCDPAAEPERADGDGGYTVSDLANLPTETRVELLDGHLFYMEAASIVHQLTAEYVSDRIKEYIRKKGGNCLTILSPGVYREEDDKNFLIPDLALVCDRSKIRKKGIAGAPDFVLEVISPSTADRDRYLKLGKYMDMGVREYWIIDTEKKLLLAYDFSGAQLTWVQALSGRKELAVFDNDLEIDLDGLRQIIEEFA